MSTPSMASQVVPVHQSPYGYSSHTAGTAYAAACNGLTPAFPSYPAMTPYQRPPMSPSSYKPASHLPSAAPSHSASETGPGPGRSKQQPDWKEFYKNGVPKEIIVIDDDSPAPQLPPLPPPQLPSRNDLRQQRHDGGTYSSYAGRKRKIDQSYAVGYDDSPTYSSHPQKLAASSSSASYHSDGRTASLQTTTAPTSLESYGSTAASTSYEDVALGQKRKRRQQQSLPDAYTDYVPPPKPPQKAKDVTVPVIRDTLHKNEKIDDQDGHYLVQPNTTMTDRYDIIKLLGQGTFGKVVEAYDKRKKTRCAVKIIRSVQKYRDASRIELRVLSTLALNDKHNRNQCIHLRDSFDFRGHICIVTDLLGQSVFDFLKGNGFVPFPSSQIQSFARQLFTSVAFLHDLNLIHTDLKPENILLVHNAYQTFTYNRTIPSSSHTTSRTARQRRVLLDSEIRLIDFGSATFDDEYHSTVVSTRHYRAPEIILQLGWSFPCDIWSIGCILVEFFTGDALFQTHDNLEHLAMMEAVCNSKIDAKLIKQVCSTARGANHNPASSFFVKNKLDYPNAETSKASRKYVKAMKHLPEFIPPTTSFNKQLLDLLKKIFVYDPAKRITAQNALKHPWFKESLVDDGTEALRIRHEREQSLAAAAQGAPEAKRQRL
ncbi:hypothetical protein DV735_g2108, partial [Chaetothyriales sp. CBS 134920]